MGLTALIVIGFIVSFALKEGVLKKPEEVPFILYSIVLVMPLTYAGTLTYWLILNWN